MDWHSIHPRTLRIMPLSETTVMVVTVAATVFTHNLAIGVVLGVVTAMIMFARRVAHMVSVEKVHEADVNGDGNIDVRRYKVRGELFFASSNDLVYQFDYTGDPANIVIDMSRSHIWDASTVASLDAITTKYAAKGKTVTITGMNDNSAQRHQHLSGQLTGAH